VWVVVGGGPGVFGGAWGGGARPRCVHARTRIHRMQGGARKGDSKGGDLQSDGTRDQELVEAQSSATRLDRVSVVAQNFGEREARMQNQLRKLGDGSPESQLTLASG
jgi:hypothetical protein